VAAAAAAAAAAVVVVVAAAAVLEAIGVEAVVGVYRTVVPAAPIATAPKATAATATIGSDEVVGLLYLTGGCVGQLSSCLVTVGERTT
jgi:hypothetical protein